MKETYRYKNMVANLKGRQPHVKEAALLKEIAGGTQWRMDAVIEAIEKNPQDWKSIDTDAVLKQAAMFGRLTTTANLCEKIQFLSPQIMATAYYTAHLHGHDRVAKELIGQSLSKFSVKYP
jgi:hypothetical protein